VSRLGVAALAAAVAGITVSRAGDYSVDPTSPEAPFTFGTADVVDHDGTGVHIGASRLGLDPGDNIDALSYGDDQVEPAGLENLVNVDFSVDRGTTGATGAIAIQAAGNGAAGDKFRILAFRGRRTVGPLLLSDSILHGLTAKSQGTNESDLDALSQTQGTTMPVFFSLDRAGSAALPTAGPSDILYVAQPGVTAPVVYASAADLLLSGNDNIDALCVMDVGAVGKLDGRDRIYASFDRTSPARTSRFTNGADGIVRLWPRPIEVIYTPQQLGLAGNGTDEINAMTARDPAPEPYSRAVEPSTSWLLGLDPGRVHPGLRFGDQTADISVKTGKVKIDGLRELALLIRSTRQGQYAFRASPHVASGVLSARSTVTVVVSDGMVSGLSTAGMEVSNQSGASAPPDKFDSLLVYSNNGVLTAFGNRSGVNGGTPQAFPGTDSIELRIDVGTAFGVEMMARQPGGDWRTVLQDARADVGPEFTFGVGCANLGPGAEIAFHDIELEGRLFSVTASYGDPLQLALDDLVAAEDALNENDGSGEPADVDHALRRVGVCVGVLQGFPGPGKSGLATFENGLVRQVADEAFGPLPEYVSPKTTSRALAKALKSAVKAQAQLQKAKPNVKKARKLLAKAQSALDDASDLLRFGTKVK